MDKIFSARLDVSVIADIERGSRLLRIPKKRFLEDAVRSHVKKVVPLEDVFQRSFGIMKRDEPPEVTVEKAKQRFRDAYERHFKGRNARLRG